MSAKNPGASNASLDEVAKLLQSNIPGADNALAMGFDSLHLLRSARAAGLQSELDRLSADVEVEEDDPRLANLRRKIAANQVLVSELTIEKERASVPIPEVKKDAWILHGIVRDRNLRGMAGVTVALYDGEGDWIRQLGYATTSPAGNFRLEARNLSGVESPLLVHILSSQGAHLHTDDVELTPEAGVVLYHEIVVTGIHAGTPPAVSPEDPVADPNVWTVRGRVANKSGEGLGDLRVSLFDKDLFFDDQLGETTTDANGEFNLTYYSDDFRDVIEKKPDLYVKVLDAKGNTIHTSKKKLRYEAGRIEILNIEIDKPGKK